MGVLLSVRLTRVLGSPSLVRFPFRGATGAGLQDTLRYPFDDGLQAVLFLISLTSTKTNTSFFPAFSIW